MKNEDRNLLIAMLLGDGTISNNYVFKMMHCEKQLPYLEYKINLLKEHGIKNNGVKTYITKIGYKPGVPVYYTQLSIKPFIKVLRRVFYRPKKQIGNMKLLNRIDAQGLGIWYMDDGCINLRYTKDKQRQIGFYIKFAICSTKEECQIIIDYFKEKWGVSFYTFKEKQHFSICCGTKEGLKFLEIISPFVPECMKYKIIYKKDWEAPKGFCVESSDSKWETPVIQDEDIV